MKKSILTFSLMTLILSSFAIGPFTIGLKGGINSNKVSTSGLSVSNFTSAGKSGYNLGAFARFGTKIYLQPEVLYCVKNSQSISGTTIQTIKLKSIQVPILLGYKLIDMKLASLRAFTGPAMSMVMSGSIASTLSTYDSKSNIWDWQVGAGFDIGMLTLDIRYELGLTNISNASSTSLTNKGNTITFSLGFKFL